VFNVLVIIQTKKIFPQKEIALRRCKEFTLGGLMTKLARI